MANGMLIKVDSDVNGAVSGINQLNKSLAGLPKNTSTAGSSMISYGSVLASTTIAFGALTAAMILTEPLQRTLNRLFSEAKDDLINLVDANRKYSEALSDSTQGTGAAVVRIFALVNAVKSGKLSVTELASAQKELVKTNPEFAGAFDKSTINVEKLNRALDDTILKIFDTIKASAATKILSKEFEKIADQILQEGKNLSLLQTMFAFTQGMGSKKVRDNIAANNLKEANDQLLNFGARVDEVFAKLKIGDVTKPFKGAPEKIEATTKALKNYKGAVDGLVTNFNIQLAFEKEQKSNATDLLVLQQKINELRKRGAVENGLSNPLDQSLKNPLKIIDPSTLDQLAGLDAVNKKALDLKDTINNGINGGIDTFFNSIANNQDPFKALAQSAQRLVVELGAAVVKMLVLKAIANVIAPGAGGFAVDAASKLGGSGIFGGLLRGQNISLSLLRGAQGG